MYQQKEFEKIKEIRRKYGWERVYDFEVPSTHSFFTNGILSHNTGKTLLARAVANESGANFFSISGPEIMCVSKDTPILLNDEGVVEIGKMFSLDGEKIKINNCEALKPKKTIKVYSLNHEFELVPDEVEYVIKVPVNKSYKITLENGAELEVSENQPFLVLEDGKINWKNTSGLNEGNYVAAIRRLTIDGSSSQDINWFKKMDQENTYIFKKYYKPIKLKEYSGTYENVKVGFTKNKCNLKKIKPIRLPTKTTPELLGFIGLMFSKGSINKDEVSISNNDKNIRETAKKMFEQLFGFDHERIVEDEDEIKVHSYTLVEFLIKTCNLTRGRKHKNTHLPAWVFQCNNDEIKQFLKMYFNGNGTIAFNQNDYPTFRYYSKIKTLLIDIQFLLLRFGITSKIIPWKTPRRNLWTLVLTEPKSRDLFYREIVSPEEEKSKIYYENRVEDDEQWLPINSLFKHIKETENIKYGADIPESGVEPYISGKKTLTIRQAKKLVDLFEPLVKKKENKKFIEIAKKFIRSDIYWTKIKKIKLINKSTILYDLTVKSNSNFLGGSPLLLLHNSMWYGKSEENLRKVFEEAEKNAPSIIFIDEIDSIAPKREEVHGEVERRVVSQLLSLMDGLKKRGKIIVIAATNRPNALDPALRRPGRFDREIEIGVPDRAGRKEIFQIHSRNMPLTQDVNLDRLADVTYGYTGADIEAVCKEAAMHALRRVLPQVKWKEEEELPKEVLEKLKVTKEDFDYALKMVEPSAMREVLVEIPNVHWDDIGGLEKIKDELKESVEWPLKYPKSFKKLGIKPPSGILLYGPPGCGKTLLAKAVATESQANFISVKGPELLSMWFGESERKIRELFRRAKQVAPVIIFFDEIDAMVPRRGHGMHEATERIVSQILTEMSGLEDLNDVVIIGATNRPDMLDTALLRPGRFDRHILVPAPDEDARLKILKVLTRNMPLKNVDLKKIARETDNYSGADLEALCREAAMNALRENKKAKEVTMKHFNKALEEVKPSLTKELIDAYKRFADRLKRKIATEAKGPEEGLGYVG